VHPGNHPSCAATDASDLCFRSLGPRNFYRSVWIQSSVPIEGRPGKGACWLLPAPSEYGLEQGSDTVSMVMPGWLPMDAPTTAQFNQTVIKLPRSRYLYSLSNAFAA
jgi:hypothetical protein